MAVKLTTTVRVCNAIAASSVTRWLHYNRSSLAGNNRRHSKGVSHVCAQNLHFIAPAGSALAEKTLPWCGLIGKWMMKLTSCLVSVFCVGYSTLNRVNWDRSRPMHINQALCGLTDCCEKIQSVGECCPLIGRKWCVVMTPRVMCFGSKNAYVFS